jgi:hypothetical protein
MSEYNENNFDASQTEVASGAEVAKRKKPIALFAVGGVLLLAIAGFISYLLIPSLKNTINMMVMKPEKYYASVENNNISKQAKKISEQYGKIIEMYNNEKGISQEYEISADINPDLLEEYDIPEQFAKIKASGSSAIKDEKLGSDIMLSVNDVKIITLKILMDYATPEAYFQIPELTDAYLKVPVEELSEEVIEDIDGKTGFIGLSYTPEVQNYNEAVIVNSFEKMFSGELISEKELEDLINKYYSIVIENIENVELEKGVEVEVGDIDAKFNTLTAKITQKDALKILEAILKEAKKDDVIIGIVEEFGICTKDEYKDFIDTALDELADTTTDKRNYIKLITYVDSKGIICGRELEVYEDKEKSEDFGLYYLAAKDGDKIAFDMLLTAEDSTFSIVLNGKEKSKETYSGDINIEVESYDYWEDESKTYSFNIDFKDFNIANEEKGYINGKFTVDLVVTKFTAEFKSDGDSQEVSIEIPKYATINIKFSQSDADDIKMPSNSDKIYDLGSDDDIESLTEDVDIEAFLEKICADLGFDLDELIDLFYGYDYDDNYDYDFDFNYDDYDYDYNYDYDYDYDYDDYVDIDYDFNNLEIKINGQKIVLSEGIANISSLIKDKGISVVKAGEMESFYSDDYTLSIDLENGTDQDLPIEKCPVDYIWYSPYPDEVTVELSVNGIKIGSTIKDIAAAFNTEIGDDVTEVYINDTEEFFRYAIFYIEDGKVSSITIS